jgi:hypothetical protein
MIMAAHHVRRLINSQVARLREIQLIGERLIDQLNETFFTSQLQSRLDAINATWAEAKATNIDLIERNLDTMETYIAEDCFGRIYAAYEEVRDRLLGMVTHISGNIECTSPSSINSAGPSAAVTNIAKLPRINLPTFSGKYEGWKSFKDLFSSLVHNVTRLPDSTKLQYLKSCLVGHAADLVKNIAVTSTNYQCTWQALEIRYYNPRAIIAKLFREFYSITPLHRESAIEIRRFTDEVLRIHRAFKNLQVPIESWDL